MTQDKEIYICCDRPMKKSSLTCEVWSEANLYTEGQLRADYWCIHCQTKLEMKPVYKERRK